MQPICFLIGFSYWVLSRVNGGVSDTRSLIEICFARGIPFETIPSFVSFSHIPTSQFLVRMSHSRDFFVVTVPVSKFFYGKSLGTGHGENSVPKKSQSKFGTEKSLGTGLVTHWWGVVVWISWCHFLAVHNSSIGDLVTDSGKVSKPPGTETFRWGGYPPPGPPRTRIFRKVNGKGGTPPTPPRTVHFRKRKFFRRKRRLLPKKHRFWANF